MMAVNRRAGQALLETAGDGDHGYLPDELAAGRAALAKYDASQLEARTIRPEDGVLTTAPLLAPAPGPVAASGVGVAPSTPPPASPAVAPAPSDPSPTPPPPPAPSSKRPPAPPPGVAGNCKPPTWTDDDGHVHMKPGCQ